MKPARPTFAVGAPLPLEFLGTLAWVLLLAAAMARMTLTEYVRDPAIISAARTGGPSYGIALDLLCCVPALLVLFRWMIVRDYSLRWTWSFGPLLALGAWIALSTLWAADRFAAAVNSSHLVAAVAILWAAAQLITGWMRLRLLAALMLGLLLVLIAQAVMYRYMELPAMQRDWNQYFCPHDPQVVQDAPGKCPLCGRPLVRRGDWELSRLGWQPGSFLAQQLESNVAKGTMLGFYESPNTYAAATVLLMVLAMGWIAQYLFEGRGREAPMLLAALGLLGGAWVLLHTASRAADATVLLAALLLAAIWRWRAWISANAARAFYIALAAVIFAMAVVAGFGWKRGNLVHSSLTFRWWYWMGAARVFRDHWFHGVGWSNFGVYYLQHRLPIASEEIKDPHNFLIRCFVETGLVGGSLAVAWLVSLWWRMTRGVPPAGHRNPAGRALGPLLAVASLATALAIIFGIDWTQDWASLAGELLKRLLFLCLIQGAAVAMAVRAIGRQEADNRPAPWLLYAMVIGIGMLMLHGMIDFALSESGPLCLMALLAGAVVGMRSGGVPTVPRRQLAATALTAAAYALWLAAAIWFWAPTVRAEMAAQAADQKIHDGDDDAAIALLQQATRDQPLNADYLYRAARVAAPGPATPAFDAGAAADRADDLLAQAMELNPMDGDYPRLRAQIDLASRPANAPTERMRADWQRVLALDPCNVWAHLQYADALRRWGDKTEARRQYAAALIYDSKLDPKNNKRLPDQEVQAVRKAIETLGPPVSSAP